MIKVFKILNGYYDASAIPNLPGNLYTRTRGNSLKLMHIRSKLDQRYFIFAHVFLVIGIHFLIMLLRHLL